jgi:tRNA (guanine-N7-)-methyltransferase
MRLRNVKNANIIIENSPYIISNSNTYKGRWKSLFNNNNPIYIEIGMGKGKFIIENAIMYPNINFIGIEKYSSVVAKAIQKIGDKNIPNLKLICIDALTIADIFDKEIDTIYLNFSDPWPKDRHAKRRLTSDIFLNLYERVFEDDYKIIMKTDNYNLYLYSKEQFINHNYNINTCSFNKDNIPVNNIMTEYEERFLSLGNDIHKIDAVKRNK